MQPKGNFNGEYVVQGVVALMRGGFSSYLLTGRFNLQIQVAPRVALKKKKMERRTKSSKRWGATPQTEASSSDRYSEEVWG
jgi:hypothetical protein